MSQQDSSRGAGSVRTLSRRSVIKGAAWSVPVIVGASALAPEAAAVSSLTNYTVPATAVPVGNGGPGTQPNAVTTVTLAAGQKLVLTASGITRWGTETTGILFPTTRDLNANPDGNFSAAPAFGVNPSNGFVPAATYGSLVGRFNQGSWFKVGSSYTSPADSLGVLQLAYNDNPNGAADNTGSYAVQIKVTP